MKVEYRLWRGAFGSVLAITSAMSATLADDENHFSPLSAALAEDETPFSPLRMYFSLPSFAAVVCMPVASAPAAFSVIEKQMRLSPFNSGLGDFSFWLGVPVRV